MGTVAEAYNHVTLEVEIERISIWVSRGEGEVRETPSQPKSWEWWYVPEIPARHEVKVGGSLSKDDLKQKMQDPI
jgi:hypothetical protein